MRNLPRHGGGLDAAIVEHGGAREDWLDLSTGINPHAWPVPPIPAEVWHRLPEQSLEDYALDAARVYYGVPEGAAIIAAPGTQAIIQRLPQWVGLNRRIGIVEPTYNEFERCLATRDRIVGRLRDIPKPEDGFDCVVIGNPNNPDGRYVGEGHDQTAIDAIRAQNGLVIADEAFADVAPEASLVPQTGPDGLLVLRSFGKFFGLAGIRLGFAIGPPRDVTRLKALLGPWAAPGPALFIAGRAMRDIAWIAETRTRLVRDRMRLASLLASHGLQTIGGTDLFVLVAHDRAPAIHEALARAHILTRAFAEDACWLRFGLPADEAALGRLDAALANAV